VPIAVVDHSSRRGWLVATASGSLTLAEILSFIQTTRAAPTRRMAPLFFDARGATTSMTENDVEQVISVVREAVSRDGPRGHVAIVADDDRVYTLMLLYETRCVDLGIRLIRVFRQVPDAERWLEAVTAARHFQ